MPKTKRRDTDAEAFGQRLVKLLAENDRPRRGAGAYLAKRVSERLKVEIELASP